MRIFSLAAAALLTVHAVAAEKVISFNAVSTNGIPQGFRSIVLGFGKPGDWKVVSEPSPTAGEGASESSVLAQLSREPLSDHFPVLLNDEVLSDFRLTTRFKINGGALEQSAGMVFRFQNASNYYLIRADALANTFRCYKVENGNLKPPLGPQMKITPNEWHTLVIQCEGTRILCGIDGQDVIKLIDNTARKTGRIGFWTKSDSQARFGEIHLTYTPHEALAQVLIRDALKEYPRVLDIAIFAIRNAGENPGVIASKNAEQMGEAGTQTEREVIAEGKTFYGKSKEWVSVTMPLRDRNGDPVAAVRLRLKSFPGQTEDNAIVRAQPIVKGMQARVQSLEELLE